MMRHFFNSYDEKIARVGFSGDGEYREFSRLGNLDLYFYCNFFFFSTVWAASTIFRRTTGVGMNLFQSGKRDFAHSFAYSRRVLCFDDFFTRVSRADTVMYFF